MDHVDQKETVSSLQSQPQKICVDCKHCVVAIDTYYSSTKPKEYRCDNPKLQLRNLVTGESYGIDCQMVRMSRVLGCGPEGLAWESKDETN